MENGRKSMKTDLVVEVDRTRGAERLRYSRSGGTDSAYWDELWDRMGSKDSRRRAKSRHIPRFLRKAIQAHVPPGGRVLEAGCGLGDLTIALAARGYRAEGCDYAPQTIARLKDEFPQLVFFLADV